MRRLPIFLAFVPVVLILYLLAWIPGINSFLVKALMPYWPIIIINGALLGLIAETFVRRLSKLWLLVPLGWFGGYGALAWLDGQAVSRLRQEIMAANADVKIPVQTGKHSLVFTSGKADDSLIQNYGLNTIYSKDARRSGGFVAVTMVKVDVCDQLRNQPPSPAGILTKGFFEEGDGFAMGPFEKRFCVLAMPQSPPAPWLTVSSATEEAVVSRMPVANVTTTIEIPQSNAEQQANANFSGEQKQKFRLRDGHASPLPWFPMPILQFGPLNGYAAPTFGFRRSRYVPLNTAAGQFTSGTASLASALGLMRIKPADRQASASADVLALIAASEKSVELDETARLEKVLGDVQADIGVMPFNTLQHRQDIIEPRIDRILAAVEAGMIEQGRGRQNAGQLFQLLKQASPEKIAPHRQRLDLLQSYDPWFKYEPDFRKVP
jgi:hypothetical protein